MNTQSHTEGREAFLPLRHAAYSGQLRTRSWQAPFAAGDYDEIWAHRAREYWARFGRLYGLQMSDFTNAFDPVDGIMTTFSTVVHVLDGPRMRLQ